MATRPVSRSTSTMAACDRIAPGDGRRLPVKGFLEAGIDPGGRSFSQPGCAACAIRARLTIAPGAPTTPTPPSRNSRSSARTFQQIGGDGEDLFAQPLAGVVHCRRQGDRAAARHRAKPDRDRGRVGKRDDDVVGSRLSIDPPRPGRRSSPCPDPAGTAPDGDIDLADGIDADKRAFERTDAGAFDIAADAEPEIAALARAPAAWRSRNAATPPTASSAFCERGRDNRRCHRRSVRRRDTECRRGTASRRRGSCCAVRTSAGSSPEFARDEVDGAFHREGGFRPPGAAIGRVRNLVGDDDPAGCREVGDLVGPVR